VAARGKTGSAIDATMRVERGLRMRDTSQRVTVLDWAASALAVAQQRIAERVAQVTWIESDVLTAPFSSHCYMVWHDRAVFHFLTDPDDRAPYVAKVRETTALDEYVIVASFAPLAVIVSSSASGDAKTDSPETGRPRR
jgi:hypothetical protein